MPWVPLRDHLEREIDHVREVIEVRMGEREEARKLQAVEYARRLDDLNHAHKANLDRNAEFVSQEKFAGLEEKFTAYKETTALALSLAAGARQGMSNTFKVIVAIAGFILTLGWIITTAVAIYNLLHGIK